MTEFTSYPHGMPNWVDLATTDVDDAARFYRNLFGWTTQQVPFTAGVDYTMCLLRGQPVAAIYPLDPMAAAGGAPSHWSSCLAVTDMSETLEMIERAGGLRFGPVLESSLGLRAAAQDPTGAFLALWERGSLVGSAFANEPGSFTWNELQTNDVTAASDFYRDVFDWKVEATQMPTGNVYHVFRRDGHELAGMMEIQPEWGPVPPNWGVYFAIDDCDAAALASTELGGGIEVPAMSISDSGRIAMLQDPQGAYFWISSGM
jgi:predicted enzyme related to lactoylglutathione lyase